MRVLRQIKHMGVNPKIGVGTPKSWILIGFSIINHPFWGPTPIFGNTHMMTSYGNFQPFRAVTICASRRRRMQAWKSSSKLHGSNGTSKKDKQKFAIVLASAFVWLEGFFYSQERDEAANWWFSQISWMNGWRAQRSFLEFYSATLSARHALGSSTPRYI